MDDTNQDLAKQYQDILDRYSRELSAVPAEPETLKPETLNPETELVSQPLPQPEPELPPEIRPEPPAQIPLPPELPPLFHS